MILSAKIISVELLCQRWGNFSEYKMSYDRLDGSIEEMCREVYDRGHSASVLLHDPLHDSVVLVRQFRPPPLINGKPPYLIEVCAGKIDEGTPAECARRESLEETGVALLDLRLVTEAYANPACLTEIVSIFIGSYDGSVPLKSIAGLPGEGEDIEVLQMSLDQAYEMVCSGQIVDMKTIIPIQALIIERLKRVAAG